MIRWVLLIPLLCQSRQDGTGQETGVLQCRPQSMVRTGSDQTILLTWEDDPSCPAVDDVLIYELVVLIADKQVHYDQVVVTPDQIGSTHSWSWVSDLALQCASVRLNSQYKLQTSPWKMELTPPGVERSSHQEVYPKDRVYEVGSTASFCCVLSEDQIFDKIYLIGDNNSSSSMSTVKISNQTYVMTVLLNQPSTTSCTDVKCKARSQDGDSESGACVYIGYPPGDKDLQCETRDLESIDCQWTGRNPASLLPKLRTTYHLLGSRCAQESQTRCSKQVKVDVGEKNWTLTAHNNLGTVELSDWADLTKRVHMFAPEEVTASSVNARTASLEWGWKLPQYNRLNITCQVNVSDGTTNTMSESSGVGLKSTAVTNLIPNWSYSVTVRCGTAQHLWKWSEWSSRFKFHTKDDVPDALDVWMQTKDSHIIIMWKMPLANQSHGNITDYEVTWTKTTETNQENRCTVPNTKHECEISLNTTEEHLVTVTARNNNGSSPPSNITVPRYDPDTTRVNTSRISGSNGGFMLSWSASPIASCGYTVDWCPSSGHGSVQWTKVPPHQTNITIFSEDLQDGVRYLLSIYACTQGAPVLLERREGYIHEKRIQEELLKTKCKQQDSDLEVSWDPLPQTQLTAFIQGYILYWSDNNNVVSNTSTDDPDATSLTARNLKIGSYNFSLKALTAVGESGPAICSATVDTQTDKLIKAVIFSLLTVFVLVPLIAIVCYRHWGCIKHKVYPPIPKPLLSDTWLTSPGNRSCRPLYMEVCHYSEADIMDIPELQSKLGAPVNDYVSDEKTPFVFSPTPKGYYNQPLKNCTPSPLLLPNTTDPSQSVLSRSPLRSVFPNLSYNLIMQTGDGGGEQCGPQPEQLEVISGGYQPQNNTETFTLNQTEEVSLTPMICISTYISLPQSPSQ